MVPSATYLGHRIDAEGLHPVAEKVKAITEAPQPKNVWELKSYLGLLTYNSKFLPKHVDCSGATLSAIAPWSVVALGREGAQVLPSIQGLAYIVGPPHPFQPGSTTAISM